MHLLIRALRSRVAVMLACVIATLVCPTHNAEVYVWAPSASLGPLAAFTRWDAARMLGLAVDGHGASAEETYAFFPLYPMALRALESAVRGVVGARSPQIMVGCALVLNAASFAVAACALRALTARVVKRGGRFADRVATLFVWSPVGVFFCAAYSEALFCALAFSGLLFLALAVDESGAVRPSLGRVALAPWVWGWCACLALALATATRANGAVNAAFFLFYGTVPLARRFAAACCPRRVRVLRACWPQRARRSLARDLAAGIVALAQSALVVAPSVAFQAGAFARFCGTSAAPLHALGGTEWPRLPGASGDQSGAWCEWRVPSIYAYVQHEYWNVGPFRYWTLKQLPQFALAAPALILAALALRRAAAGVHHRVASTHTAVVDATGPALGVALARLDHEAFAIAGVHDSLMYVHDVDEEGACDRAGLCAADALSHVDGEWVGALPLHEVYERMRAKHADPRCRTIELRVWRGEEAYAAEADEGTAKADDGAAEDEREGGAPRPWSNRLILPFAVHAAALALLIFTTAHVQIATRVLGSSCPALYWVLAELTRAPRRTALRKCEEGAAAWWWRWWAPAYTALGIVLHSNFFPWT